MFLGSHPAVMDCWDCVGGKDNYQGDGSQILFLQAFFEIPYKTKGGRQLIHRHFLEANILGIDPCPLTVSIPGVLPWRVLYHLTYP